MRCSQNRCARTATTYKNTAGVVFFVPIQNTTGVPEPPLPILLLEIMSDGRAFHSLAVVGKKLFPKVLDECLI